MRAPSVPLAIVLALAGMTASCSSSGNTSKAVPTGFLSNYEMEVEDGDLTGDFEYAYQGLMLDLRMYL